MSALRDRGIARSLLAAAAALIVLSGCSATRLAYNNADVWLRWQAGRYLDLREEQYELLDMRIAAFLAWHRAEAMPLYARLGEEAGARFADGLSRADLVWGYDAIRAQAREGLRMGAEEIAPLLDRLAPPQIAHFEKRLAEDNRKFAEEHLQGTPEERKARRLRRNLERLEDWLGTLSEAQVELVRRYAARAPLVGAQRDAERRRRQAELVEMLRRREASRRLADWAANWDRGRDPAYAAALEAQREAVFDMLLALDATLEPRQRQLAASRLAGYTGDIRALAEQGGVRRASR